MEALVGIALGAALTWLASLYGASKEAAREHSRWLRDRRYEACAEILSATTEAAAHPRYDLLPLSTPPTPEQLASVRDSQERCMINFTHLADAVGRLTAIGPDTLRPRTRAILDAAASVLIEDKALDQVKDAMTRLRSEVDDFQEDIRDLLGG